MRVSEITLEHGGTLKLASLTYDEELELAKSVMETLSKKWARGKFRDLAISLYETGTGGYSCEAINLHGYSEALKYWSNKLEDAECGSDAPHDPLIEMDNNMMVAPTSIRGGKETSTEWRANWYVEERRRAWREMWEVYRKALCAISNDYRVFPGDSNAALELHELAQLQPFFDAVRASQQTYGCSLDQAMREVMDRMPHAELTLDDLYEIINDYP